MTEEKTKRKRKPASPKQIDYIMAYNRQHIRFRKACFNDQDPEDLKMMDWIDSQEESTSAYLKRLVYEDMTRH